MLTSTLKAQVLCWEAVRCPTQGLHDSTSHLSEADTLARAAHRAHTVSKGARQRGARSQLCVLIQLLLEARLCTATQLLQEAPDCAQRLVIRTFVLGSPTMHSSVMKLNL